MPFRGEPVRLLVTGERGGGHRAEDSIRATTNADTGSDQGALQDLHVVAACPGGHADEAAGGRRGGGRCRTGHAGRSGAGSGAELELRRCRRIDVTGDGESVPTLEVRHRRLGRGSEHAIGAAGHEDPEGHQRALQLLDAVALGTDRQRARGGRGRSDQPERGRGCVVEGAGGRQAAAGLIGGERRLGGGSEDAVGATGDRHACCDQCILERNHVRPGRALRQPDERLGERASLEGRRRRRHDTGDRSEGHCRDGRDADAARGEPYGSLATGHGHHGRRSSLHCGVFGPP